MRFSITAGDGFQKTYRRLADEFDDAATSALILALTLEHVSALVSLSTEGGDLIFASSAHGLLDSAVEDQHMVSDYSELFPRAVREEILALSAQDPLDQSYQRISLQLKDGDLRVYQFRKTLIHVGGLSRVLLIANPEVDENARSPDDRTYESAGDPIEFHDAVTGVANRLLLFDRLDKTLSLAKRNKKHFALLLIDLDRFQEFNEAHGTDIGDRYLQHVAKHFTDVVRDTDTVARMSGDEFIIILDNVDKAKDIELVAHKLIEPKSLAYSLNDAKYACTASMGISLFPKDGDTADDLLRNADKAMSKAKNTGKNQHQFFIKAMTDAAANYLLLENDLQKAIDAGELELFFQPQVRSSDGAVRGVEVLCRWQHSSRGLLLPTHFIPLAEEIGMIETLGRWVLKDSCQRFNAWLEQGIDFGKLSVNVSAKQFRNPHFKSWVQEVMEDSGLPYDRLELELTETSTMQNATRTIDVLTELRKWGISIALDDFGTGYSSLAYLRRFPIQKLKIDKSFIENVARNSHDEATAKSIIDLAHNMSLEVIAEGVEREEQLVWLKENGCELVQGYIYAKPLSETDLLSLVDNRKRAERRGSEVLLKHQ